MLVIPYQTRFSLATAPFVTLTLIALNVFAYFVVQAGDGAAMNAAREYYFSSELARLELPRYVEQLERRNDAAARNTLREIGSLARKPQPWPLVMTMQNDRDFQRQLAAGRIIKPGAPEYSTWREQRSRFNALLARVPSLRGALTPEWGEPQRLLTYQFLHGDAVHLIGNMLVLLLAGPFAEAALGRWRFAAAYLIAGVVAGLAHLLVSPLPLVGASGAVSGAMAMVAVLYGTRRVPVFWTVGFYFDTARVPALALLPAWIAIEAVAWAIAPDGPVAYWAHLGGFVAGAALAWWWRPSDEHKLDRILEDHEDSDLIAQRRARLIDTAQQAAARMDVPRALRAYGELAAAKPDDIAFATARFNIALLSRDRQALADAAAGVLAIRTRGARTQLRTVYLQMALPKVQPALSVEEQLRLARRLVAAREDAAALRVLDRLLDDVGVRTHHGRELTDCLLGLHTTYARHGLRHQADSVRDRLSQHFPQPATLMSRPAPAPSKPHGVDESHTPLELDMATQFHTRPYDSR
ncbi:MAG: rhomboid family intramembrane serine protease [Burkholderiaceae bacterium]